MKNIVTLKNRSKNKAFAKKNLAGGQAVGNFGGAQDSIWNHKALSAAIKFQQVPFKQTDVTKIEKIDSTPVCCHDILKLS